MIKSPNDIPGLITWVETDEYGVLTDKLGEEGIKRGAVFVWVDPNNPARGCQLIFSPAPSPEDEARINEWLVEHFNPPMDQLPRS